RRAAQSVHSALPSQYTARCPVSTRRVAQSVHSALPSQYTAHCPVSTRRSAHSMHRTYRPVEGLLGTMIRHLTLVWMITKQLHHICLFFNNIWIHQFAWMRHME